MNTIPEWMTKEENYVPSKDSDGFITRSILSAMSVISAGREFGQESGRKSGQVAGLRFIFRPAAPVKLLMALVMIVLASCSRNMMFTYCMIAVLLVHMCFLEGKKLTGVFCSALAAAGISALLLLPAVFLGSPGTMLTVSIKVFLSAGLLAFLNATTPWNRITEGFRFFFVPDLLIFTFDIALKYIIILGDICLDMLNSLKLRSVGRNHSKSKSISGIPGFAFVKSRHMAEEMSGAMCCRGFEGEYHRPKLKQFGLADVMFLIFMALVAGLFVYL